MAERVAEEPNLAAELAMPARERILARTVSLVTAAGMALLAAYALSTGLSEISSYLARWDVVDWMLDIAMLASVPWEIVATVLVIMRWRDLPQRFWITYCVNGLLSYVSLPIYLMHFGLYR
jgi:hypothetical protein